MKSIISFFSFLRCANGTADSREAGHDGKGKVGQRTELFQSFGSNALLLERKENTFDESVLQSTGQLRPRCSSAPNPEGWKLAAALHADT